MSLMSKLKTNKKVKGARKVTTKKDMSIEQMRDRIDCIIAQSYSPVGKTAYNPIISVEDVNTITDLISAMEHKLGKTILPSRLVTNSELCSVIQFNRRYIDDETYVAVLKQYYNYLIENNIPNN